jgi:hypothetical protein
MLCIGAFFDTPAFVQLSLPCMFADAGEQQEGLHPAAAAAEQVLCEKQAGGGSVELAVRDGSAEEAAAATAGGDLH